MKLMGKDITPAKVMAFVGERLAARGLSGPGETDVTVEGVEPRVDPLSFNLHALEDNADATRGLPLETHRDGLAGRAVVVAKRLFRSVGQVFINEALGRQRVFNGHVRDSYAQLSAEVLRLRQRVAELERDAHVATVVPLPAPQTVSPPVVIPDVGRLIDDVGRLIEAPAGDVALKPREKPLPPPPPPVVKVAKAAPKPKPVAKKPPAPPSAPRPPPRTSRRGK